MYNCMHLAKKTPPALGPFSNAGSARRMIEDILAYTRPRYRGPSSALSGRPWASEPSSVGHDRSRLKRATTRGFPLRFPIFHALHIPVIERTYLGCAGFCVCFLSCSFVNSQVREVSCWQLVCPLFVPSYERIHQPSGVIS